MVLPPLQPILGDYVRLLFHRFDSVPYTLPSSRSQLGTKQKNRLLSETGGKPLNNANLSASLKAKQKKQPMTEMPSSSISMPTTLVTAPTFQVPIAPIDTKPVSFSQTVMSSVSPSKVSPNTRKLVDTLYEGVEFVAPSDKQVAPIVDDKEIFRGRPLVPMPSVSDFRVSPTPSPTRALAVKVARPMQQPFKTLKTHGFYIRSGRIVVPDGASLVIYYNLQDTLHLYLGSDHIATVQADIDFEDDDLPFLVESDRLILPPGDYFDEFEASYTVSVVPDSIYSIDAYIPL